MRAKFAVRTVGALFVAIGCIGWFAGFLIVSGVVKIPGWFEMPLGALEGIAVDSDGNIYCGLQFYCRVQVYDPQGNYLRAKFVDSAAGTFRIRINQDDELEVATARNDKLYRFAKDGTLINELSGAHHFFHEFGEIGETQYHDERRNVTYRIKWSPLGAYITKRGLSGDTKIIIRTPFHKWLFTGPFPAWFFVMVGAVMFACTSKDALKYVLRGHL